MFIEQIYTKCLSESAYYIESDGEAAIIDPLRDVKGYIDLATQRGAVIKYVFETHFHADFISGHIELASQTGASIIYGPGAMASYPITCAADGEDFKIGRVTLKVLHTPGHTLESCCYLLLDERQNPHSVFTGDTLFVGDVGRPDLAAKDDLNMFELAAMLYESLESKLKPLPNYVVVYPGHGAGSACGKAIGQESFSTIGVQKATNYAMKAASKEEFVKLVTEGLTPPPAYFFHDADVNRKGYQSTTEIVNRNLKPLSIEETRTLLKSAQVTVVDCRSGKDFANGFIPGSVHLGLDGPFAVTCGSLIGPGVKLLLVCEPGRENEAVTRLSRIAYENVAGYLNGGFDAWKHAGLRTDFVPCVEADWFEENFRYTSATVLDVRNPDEWVPGFVAGAKLIELPQLEKRLGEIDRDKDCFVYCASGYRSMTAASLLKRNGFRNVINITGGMMKIRKTAISIRQLSTHPH